ncbi:MAG: hypothetical protein ACXABY_16685 [Candidatus Thorarchaeota archaeon]|jgi:co-chaperonin GroES (HSP10)
MKPPELDDIDFLEPEDLKVRPVEKYLFLELDEKHEKVGAIQLSAKQRQITRVGTVKAIGPRVTPEKFTIGDKVLIDYWAGHNMNLPKYKIFEGTHKMVPENEIWSFIDE